MTTARRLPDALAQSPAGAALVERFAASQRAAAAIEPECKRIVPDLAPKRSGVCDLHGSTLRVNARSSAQVAKLRQAVPRLLSQLRQQGLDVNEIKFGVQPRSLSSSKWGTGPETNPGAQESVRRAPASGSDFEKAIGFASKLSLTLPNSPLRDAARRLLSSLKRGVARMRESNQARDQQDDKEDDA